MIKPNIVLEGEFSQFEDLFKENFPGELSYGAGETVLNLVDERDQYCYYVLSGSVKSDLVSKCGALRTSAIRSRGTVFPLYYTYAETSIEKVHEFVAMDRGCKLIRMRKSELLKLMVDVPAIGVAMMDAWGKFATYLCYLVTSQGDSVRMRVCSLLYFSSDSFETIHASQQQIAEGVGSSRETVTRVLCDLSRRNIIKQGRGVIRITNRAALEAMASSVAQLPSSFDGMRAPMVS